MKESWKAVMNENLKIDEVAKQSGLSKRTIRYYEEIGLLEAPPRSDGGTRLYSQAHVDFLKKITAIKDVLGFSLQELHHFLNLRENFEKEREDYRQQMDPSAQIGKLKDILEAVDEQIFVLEEKVKKIFKVQEELVSVRERARARLEKMELEEKQLK
jgi:DNA-binding transcriptional MerR regulator